MRIGMGGGGRGSRAHSVVNAMRAKNEERRNQLALLTMRRREYILVCSAGGESEWYEFLRRKSPCALHLLRRAAERGSLSLSRITIWTKRSAKSPTRLKRHTHIKLALRAVHHLKMHFLLFYIKQLK